MMIKRTFAPALMALILGVSAFSTPAFAYTGETEATEERVITIQTSTEESKAEAQTETQKETEIKKTEEKEAEQFQLDEETMKEIQKMLLAYLAGNDMEDDYGMIDGVINNGPKDERKSVLEQLKENVTEITAP